jgi:SUMO ligase MMS21 Smc5/6 complex component
MVNQGISARMRSSNVFDEVNSVAILDIYAQTIPIVIDDSLSDIEHLFSRERKVA